MSYVILPRSLLVYVFSIMYCSHHHPVVSYWLLVLFICYTAFHVCTIVLITIFFPVVGSSFVIANDPIAVIPFNVPNNFDDLTVHDGMLLYPFILVVIYSCISFSCVCCMPYCIWYFYVISVPFSLSFIPHVLLFSF